MERDRERLNVFPPERRDGVVIGMSVRGDEAHRHIPMRRTLDPAR